MVGVLKGPQQSELINQKIRYDCKKRIEPSNAEKDDAVEPYASLMNRFYTKCQCVDVLNFGVLGCLMEIVPKSFSTHFL